MKRLLHLLKPYTIRPLVYSCFSKTVVGFCGILVWDRFVNVKNTIPYPIVGDGFFILALWFFSWAWFQYLAFDGMRTKFLTGLDYLAKKGRKHSNRQMMDFVNEKIITFDDLIEEEQIAVKLCSDVIVGLLFLFPGFIFLIF